MAGTFTKHGLVYEDHHFKDGEGHYQGSPPKNLKTLYDFLPTERDQQVKQTPQKVVLKCDINALKLQGHCLGVYTLIHGKTHNDRPMWKHAIEDLILCYSKGGKDDDVWVVADSKTIHTKERRCLKGACDGDQKLPFAKAIKWSEWNGRDWQHAEKLSCKPSHHGWGADGGDGWNTPLEKSYHDHQFAMHKSK